ncbi:NAD(P)H-dependent glycerol-3-phosphate dehydrogenase [Devriesea agamarum]|uniref:NAD(P)H-dependent glycerol-3-phosphate dehydrogenase n=1 Tax=Devriesea agamarum TaxID=472569 RepID=UPI00071D9E15|nr:NAD(P)H-dependent glycerol-3-phosphate dehydrogenase [Devriesea agamarum]
MSPRVAVLGAGSWGTVIANVIADAGGNVTLWARRTSIAQEIRRRGCNEAYLPGVALHERVTATSRIADALSDTQLIVCAIPAQALRHCLGHQCPALPEVPVLSLAKGIEQGTDLRMSEVISEAGNVPPERVLVLSGPNLAREIAAKQPSASAVAGIDDDLTAQVAKMLAAPYFRPYLSRDPVGVEIAGATKNVIALAVGMAGGAGYGHNTTATLMTRGLAEITRLGIALGADEQTFAGLAGLGDLVATCASPLSRNNRVGTYLGQGLPLEEAVRQAGQTAEGVTTAPAVLELARRHRVDMPLTAAVVDVVHHGAGIEHTTARLLARPLREEIPGGRVL